MTHTVDCDDHGRIAEVTTHEAAKAVQRLHGCRVTVTTHRFREGVPDTMLTLFKYQDFPCLKPMSAQKLTGENLSLAYLDAALAAEFRRRDW